MLDGLSYCVNGVSCKKGFEFINRSDDLGICLKAIAFKWSDMVKVFGFVIMKDVLFCVK